MTLDLDQPQEVAPDGPADTGALLAEFRAARQAPRRQLGRRVVGAIAAAFGLVALLAVATHDQGSGGTELAVVSTPAPSATQPAAVPTSATGATSSGGSGGRGAGRTGSAGGAPSAAPVATSPGAGGGSEGGGGSSTTPTPTTAAPEAPPEVAVVGPLLRVFSFGSKVGLPLLCSVGASAVAAQVPDPAVAQVITTVVTSCLEFGSQGDVALRALSEQLSALSAANPATTPVVEALAAAFNTAGSEDVPFAESLLALGNLVGFFAPAGS